jgi:hypothetical protein
MTHTQASLLRKIENALHKIEQRQKQESSGCVVIYDPATHKPLPGYEPSEKAIYQIWLPQKQELA